jgi:hypothetical protein
VSVRDLTLRDVIAKAQQGPFIGPKNGKWADAAHTIPWHAASGLEHRQTSILGAADEGSNRKAPLRRIEQGELARHLRAHGHSEGRHATPSKGGASGVHVRQHSATLVEVKHIESHHRDHTGKPKAHLSPEEVDKLHAVERGHNEKVVRRLKAAGYHVQADGAGRTLVGRRGEAPATAKARRKPKADSAQQGLFERQSERKKQAEPQQQLGLFGKAHGAFSAMLAKAIKGQQAGSHKYVRRVPKPGGGWRYYYAESSSARSAQEGEEVNLGGKKIKVHKVHSEGLTIEGDDGKKKTVSHDEWTQMLAEHYGSRFYEWAEKRARQYAGAVLKHVPAELLSELKGDTDSQRFADMAKRLPEVHAKLEKALGRAGVNADDAKRAIRWTLERKGWTDGARQTLIGSMLDRETAWVARNYRKLSRAAENLAKADGAEAVDTKHVAAAIHLPRSVAAMERVVNRATSEIAHLREVLKLALTPGPDAEQQPLAMDAKMSAEALAKVRAAHMIGQLQAMAQAYPGMRDDPAMNQLRVFLGGLQSVAPRTEPTKKGAHTTVYVAGEFGQPEPMGAEWVLMDADDVITSHDPATFSKDARHNVGNERAYHRDKAEQLKVIGNAENLRPDLVINTNPDATNGAPIVDENGVVLGGNSRGMSMKRAYRQGGAKAADLKGYLKDNARQFGFKPDDVDAMKAPVLVRKVQPRDDAHKQLLVRQLNESMTQAMDPRTMAVAQARRMDSKVLAELGTSMGADETLAAYLRGKGAEGFVNQLKRAGVISAANQNAYMKNGRLNQNGVALVENVLVGSMVPDADLLSEVPQSIMESLARAVPYMVQAEGAGADYGVKEDLAHALDAVVEIQDKYGLPKGKKGRAASLEAWQRNVKAREVDGKMATGLHPAQGPNARATAILNALIHQGGPVQLAKVFRKYAEQAHKQEPGAEPLAFYDKKRADTIFEEAFGSAADEDAAQAKAAADREKHVKATKAAAAAKKAGPATDHASEADKHEAEAEGLPERWGGDKWTSTKERAQDAHTAAAKAHRKAHESGSDADKAAAAAASKAAADAVAAGEREEADAAASQGGLF